MFIPEIRDASLSRFSGKRTFVLIHIFVLSKTIKALNMKTSILTLAFSAFTMLTATAQSTSNSVVLQTQKLSYETIISWENNKEVNASNYLVQKSTNGIDFKIVAYQSAQGSTPFSQTYSFVDFDDTAKNVQYKVVLILMDGSQITSSPSQCLDQALVNCD